MLVSLLAAVFPAVAADLPIATPNHEDTVEQAILGEVPEPLAAPEPVDLRSVWASQDPVDLLAEARRRIDVGDYTAADARLQFLIDTHDAPAAWFEQGRSFELQERRQEARSAYQATLALVEDPLLERDVLYRSALVDNDLRDHQAAKATLKKLRAHPALDDAARPLVELELGVAEVGLDKRRGERRIAQALESLQGEGHAWAQSRARFALTRAVLDDAAELPLEGNRKAARNLKRRAKALTAAEQQIIAIAKTGEPEYALHGILELGDAYLELHDDFIAAPPPRKLSEEQVLQYQSAVADKAAVLRRKAHRYYDEGVALAARVGWSGGVAGELERRRDALDAAADGG